MDDRCGISAKIAIKKIFKNARITAFRLPPPINLIRVTSLTVNIGRQQNHLIVHIKPLWYDTVSTCLMKKITRQWFCAPPNYPVNNFNRLRFCFFFFFTFYKLCHPHSSEHSGFLRFPCRNKKKYRFFRKSTLSCISDVKLTWRNKFIVDVAKSLCRSPPVIKKKLHCYRKKNAETYIWLIVAVPRPLYIGIYLLAF